MSRRTLTSTIATLLLAATPTAAFADGAGDQQYQDPLTAPSAPKKPAKQQASTTPAATTPATTSAPAATTAPASTSASSTPTVPAAASSPTSQQLPRTGAPAGLIAMGGLVLVASGALLRRRTATR